MENYIIIKDMTDSESLVNETFRNGNVVAGTAATSRESAIPKLIAEDGLASIVSHFASTLARQGWLVVCASTTAALERQIERNGPPALVIVTAGALNGAEQSALMRLRHTAATRTLVMVDAIPVDYAQKLNDALYLNADELIFWPATDFELVLRVHRLLEAHAASLSSAALPRRASAAKPRRRPQFHENGWQTDGPVGESDEWRPPLSKIELRIFHTLADAAPGVVPVEQLVRYVDVDQEDKGINAVRVHINRMRKKLESDPQCPIQIITLRGRGYGLQAGAQTQK